MNSDGALSVSCAVALLACLAAGCRASDPVPGPEPRVTATYSPETSRLELLTSDRNRDGKIDTWAFMDGPRLDRIELDRDGDEKPDRWEYYKPGADGLAEGGSAPAAPVIVRAEERSGPDQQIKRQEFFEDGVLQRVEEDTNGDGRVNKWEQHANGKLAWIDLDLQGKGFPDHRLFYGPGGVQRVEVDLDGDGVFVLAPASKAGQ